MNQNTQMGDKERLNDCLMSQKQMTSSYDTFANECSNEQLMNEMLSIQKEEHQIQHDLYKELVNHGWYQTTPADGTKIQQALQKFQNSAM